jgi:MFS family permease
MIGQLRELPGSVRLLLAGHLVSALGTGLVLPFLVVYLHRVRGLPLAVATLCVAVVAVGSVPANAVAGWEIDRRGARPVLFVGLVVSVVGEVLLATTHEAWQALASTLVEGIGAGIEWPALAALLASAATGTHRPVAFGLKHGLSNAGFACGGVIAALAVRDLRPGPLVTLYLLNAVSFAVFAALLLARPSIEMPAAPGDRLAGSYRQVLTDRRFRRLLGVTALLVGCGYAQLHAAFPAYLARPDGIGPSALAIAFTANTLAVVALQLPVLRWGASWPRRWLVAGGALAFAACWLIVLAAGSTGGGHALILVALAMVTMAGAEVLLSPSLDPLVNSYAPDDLRGRYNATQTLTWSGASVAGPAAVGPLLQVGGAPLLFGLLIAGCAAAAVLATRLREEATVSA